jgi:ASC-1-like (ASCH) protein
MTHYLKTVQPFFDAVWEGEKKFEVRVNDRNFQVGDTVYLEEWDVEKKELTGRRVMTKINYILDDPQYVKDGYVVFCWE